MNDLGKWLQKNRLGAYERAFIHDEELVFVEDLAHIEMQEAVALCIRVGMKFGAKKRFLRLVSELSTGGAVVAKSAPISITEQDLPHWKSYAFFGALIINLFYSENSFASGSHKKLHRLYAQRELGLV